MIKDVQLLGRLIGVRKTNETMVHLASVWLILLNLFQKGCCLVYKTDLVYKNSGVMLATAILPIIISRMLEKPSGSKTRHAGNLLYLVNPELPGHGNFAYLVAATNTNQAWG